MSINGALAESAVADSALADLRRRARRRRELPPPAVRRAIRQAAGATQLELATVLGVERATVARYEAGTRTPRGRVLERYLAALEALR